MNKKVLIVGSGLGSLATALRLSSLGYEITILEKNNTAGGRLNILEDKGFRFDLGPSFMSMTYELDELFNYCKIPNPIKLIELEPLYKVYFEKHQNPFIIYKDLDKLQKEFALIESGLKLKIEKYLASAEKFFKDTEHRIIKRNFSNKLDYLLALSTVPKKHLPALMKSMWQVVDKTFESEELKVLFSLVAFFLGSTPYDTPSIYSVLSYTEMKYNGYWIVEGGMYKIVEEIINILQKQKVKIVYNTEIINYSSNGDKLEYLIDNNKQKWFADIFIINSDAAAFRGKVFGRTKYTENKLDKMDWTLAPFTVYLGINKKINNLIHHNYFLGSNFGSYAKKIFKSSVSPKKPYYYVNIPSKSYPNYAPEGKESIFILCPVPDLRYKNNWNDKEELANNIINDISKRIDFNIKDYIEVLKIYTPEDWMNKFNLYKGSGLGLAHGISQIGGLRPGNKDEYFKNTYYVGASTIPGTGLPMVIISSKLVTERVLNEYSDI